MGFVHMAEDRQGDCSPTASRTASSLVRDFGVGAVAGSSLGALGAVLTKFPVGPPAVRCGAVGGCLASCYLPITVRLLCERAIGQGGRRDEMGRDHVLKWPCQPRFPGHGSTRLASFPSQVFTLGLLAALPCGAARRRRPGKSRACGLNKVCAYVMRGISGG